MRNIKLIVAYDGTNYLGWQKTPTGPSIESALQEVLEQILQQPISLQAASRTDAGVHAVGQVVNFIVHKPDLDLSQLQISLNSLLPKDIGILDIQEVSPHFHPTLDCTQKEYRYYICHDKVQLPHQRLYSWHYHYLLDLEEMKKSIPILIGSHDFSAFCNSKKNAEYEHYQREITNLEITSIDAEHLCIIIKGNNFLYKMVRNVVGTLVYIGRGKIQLSELPDILAEGDRSKIGMTAPAHGLFLYRVYY